MRRQISKGVLTFLPTRHLPLRNLRIFHSNILKVNQFSWHLHIYILQWVMDLHKLCKLLTPQRSEPMSWEKLAKKKTWQEQNTRNTITHINFVVTEKLHSTSSLNMYTWSLKKSSLPFPDSKRTCITIYSYDLKLTSSPNVFWYILKFFSMQRPGLQNEERL